MERKWLLPVAGLTGMFVLGAGVLSVWLREGRGSGGGKQPSLPSLPVTPAPLATRTQPQAGVMLAVGNSMTVGNSYANVLGQLLASQGATMTKVARSGASTAWMRDNALARMPALRPNTVIVLGGVNDGAGRGTIQNLRTIYQAAKQQGARVIALTELPWRGYARWVQAAQDRQDAARRWILAGGDGLVDVAIDTFLALSDPARPGYLDPNYDSGDHLHPNAAGQRRIAQFIAARAFGM